MSLSNWTSAYMYSKNELENLWPNEYGKLKCGDIYIHFLTDDISSERSDK